MEPRAPGREAVYSAMLLPEGQERRDVGLGALRLPLREGEPCEVSLVQAGHSPTGRWRPGHVAARQWVAPSVAVYRVRLEGCSDEVQASTAQVRRRFPLGALVSVYQGAGPGWMNAVVVSGQSAGQSAGQSTGQSAGLSGQIEDKRTQSNDFGILDASSQSHVGGVTAQAPSSSSGSSGRRFGPWSGVTAIRGPRSSTERSGSQLWRVLPGRVRSWPTASDRAEREPLIPDTSKADWTEAWISLEGSYDLDPPKRVPTYLLRFRPEYLQEVVRDVLLKGTTNARLTENDPAA